MNKTLDSVAETARMTAYYRREYSALIGHKIMDVRAMYPEEMDVLMWHGEQGAVFTLDDGTLFVPMQDEEGNGPGQLMLQKRGK
jgi:hypothetical protein